MSSSPLFVTVRLGGGFGNQLFQVAAMLGYAERSGGLYTPVFLEEYVDKKSWEHTGSALRIRDFFPEVPVVPRSVASTWLTLQEKPENCFTYIELPYTLPCHAVELVGYFQSDLYFPVGMRGFPTSPPLPTVLAEASLVAALAANDWSRTVFLHVRRGDYLSPANQHHHVDLVGYYREALALVGGFIGSKGRDGVCFVVSDDIEWCQRVLFDQIRDAWNGAWLWCPAELSDAETLYWTSMCARGGICANSTFSWWAAYFLWRQFGDAATLVMPRPWGKPPMPDRRDLYPAWATVLGPV